ncbi:MAG: MltR family transcriptional regulator [Candidatus Latescibacter sp.]|nr:MltR family transcriptional regulator [Candidatus Latescibacter sp.]
MSIRKRTDLNEYKWDTFFDEFRQETPRAAVIISGAFLDSLLRDLIASFMIDEDNVVGELLGSDKNSETPLSSFGTRIKTAYCLGLISKAEYNDLKIIKKIRNKFAHKLHGYSFEEKEIVGLCNSLQKPVILKVLPVIQKSHRDKFVITVSILANQLGIKILDVQRERRTVKDDMQLAQVIRVEGKSSVDEIGAKQPHEG